MAATPLVARSRSTPSRRPTRRTASCGSATAIMIATKPVGCSICRWAEKAAIRLVASHVEDDGYGRNVRLNERLNDRNTTILRGTLKLDLGNWDWRSEHPADGASCGCGLPDARLAKQAFARPDDTFQILLFLAGNAEHPAYISIATVQRHQ